MVQVTQLEDQFLQAIALNGLAPLAGERTVQALYYILRGRKANQTLQDVHIYHLQPYYRLFPRLLKERWEEIVSLLVSRQFLRMIQIDSQKHSFLLTDAGQTALREGREKYSLDRWLAPLQTAAAADRISLFWLRLHLMVQTVSQLLSQDTSFYPVVQQKQVQAWVKRQLETEEGKRRWKEGLFAELFRLLKDFSPDLQQLLVKQFSGAGQTGLTLQQIAYLRQEAPSYLRLKMRSCLALMERQVSSDGGKTFPLLSRLCADQREEQPGLSASAGETYRLLKRQLSVAEIAKIRNLTQNTVEDHLVEIALNCPEWDISPYVTAEAQEKIIAASEELQTSRLRLLKDRLGGDCSYLQIRLALARKRRDNGGQR
jgi:uncharacterized protein YpbB